jgi:hypothetical protein
MTTNRTRSVTRLAGAAGTLFLALGVGPLAAQDDARWLAWQGCWQPTSDPLAAEVAADAQAYVVCVTPADGGARFTTVADGQTVAERTVVANGAQRPIEQSGCRGWESARWSEDEQRVYLRSELTCEGGTTRTTTGVLTMASPEEWLDVQGVSAGDNTAVRVRRYQVASQARIEAAGAQQALGDRALALATARTAAAQELSLNDVREATTVLAAPVVEAMLVERQSRIRLDADALISLADAGVPASVIDLMVAQANPDRFMIDRDARSVGEAQAEDRAEEAYGRYDRPPIYAGWGYDPWGYDPFWYGYGGRYGYGYGGGYGYRDPFSRYYGGGPRIIVIRTDNDGFDNDRGGRMVKGRGYVPRQGSSGDGGARGSSSGTSSVGSSSSGSGSGTASSGSGSSSGSSTGRKAKRRGGGGGGI